MNRLTPDNRKRLYCSSIPQSRNPPPWLNPCLRFDHRFWPWSTFCYHEYLTIGYGHCGWPVDNTVPKSFIIDCVAITFTPPRIFFNHGSKKQPPSPKTNVPKDSVHRMMKRPHPKDEKNAYATPKNVCFGSWNPVPSEEKTRLPPSAPTRAKTAPPPTLEKKVDELAEAMKHLSLNFLKMQNGASTSTSLPEPRKGPVPPPTWSNGKMQKHLPGGTRLVNSATTGQFRDHRHGLLNDCCLW